MTCREETESYGVFGRGGRQREGRRGGGNVEVRSLTRTFVLRHSIAISLCAIVIHLVHDDFSLFVSISQGFSASHRPPIAHKTNELNEHCFLSQNVNYTCTLFDQTSEKTRRKNEERMVINLCVYVFFLYRDYSFIYKYSLIYSSVASYGCSFDVDSSLYLLIFGYIYERVKERELYIMY